MVDALGNGDETAPGKIERLIDSLTGELRQETPGQFVRELDAVLRQVTASVLSSVKR